MNKNKIEKQQNRNNPDRFVAKCCVCGKSAASVHGYFCASCWNEIGAEQQSSINEAIRRGDIAGDHRTFTTRRKCGRNEQG